MTPRLIPVCTLLLALGTAGCSSSESLSAAPGAQPASATVVAASSLADALRPLHAEALELARLVLAAAPSADVAAVVSAVAQTQQGLRDAADGEQAQAGRTPGEAAALTASELEAVRGATGDEAVRLGLDALVRNHLEMVSRAKAEVVEGREGPGGELSRRVLDDVGADLQALSTLG